MKIAPDLQSSLLCDDVRQERNGKFILIGLFDALWSNSVPLHVQKMCIANRWCSGAGTFNQQSRILSPNRQDVLVEGKPMPVRLADELHTATNVEFFMNLEFKETGVYWIEVLLEEQLKLSYPLRIGLTQQQPSPPAP